MSSDPNASYIILSSTGSLPNAGVLTAGTGITLSVSTISIKDNIASTISGTTFQGPVVIDAANTLSVGSGSFQISSNEVSWGSNNKIFLNGSDLVFKDDNNPTQTSLTTIALSGSAAEILNASTSSVTEVTLINSQSSWQSITGLSASVTCSGHPIFLAINTNYNFNSLSGTIFYSIFRDSTNLGPDAAGLATLNGGQTTIAGENAPILLQYIDNPGAGAYNYTVKARSTGSNINEAGDIKSIFSFFEMKPNIVAQRFASSNDKYITTANSSLQDYRILNTGTSVITSSITTASFGFYVADNILQIANYLSGNNNNLYSQTTNNYYRQYDLSTHAQMFISESITSDATPIEVFSYTPTRQMETICADVFINAQSLTTTGSYTYASNSHFFYTGSSIQQFGETNIPINSNTLEQQGLNVNLISSASSLSLSITG